MRRSWSSPPRTRRRCNRPKYGGTVKRLGILIRFWKHTNICQGSQPMPRVRFTLPEVNEYPDARPSSCPHCAGAAFHKHACLEKRIKDLYITRVTVVRYKCADCGRTFRRYPSGVDGHSQNKRLRALAALSWALVVNDNYSVRSCCLIGICYRNFCSF